MNTINIINSMHGVSRVISILVELMEIKKFMVLVFIELMLLKKFKVLIE